MNDNLNGHINGHANGDMDSKKPKTKADVIIAGGGPVGLLIALNLGRANISTIVLESHPTILPLTRAMVYMPVVVPLLKKFGIYEAVAETAYLHRDGVRWRDVEGNELGHLQLGSPDPDKPFGGVLLLGQAKISKLILDDLQKNCPSVDVRFGGKVVGLEDDPAVDHVKVMVHHHDAPMGEDVILEAKYLLGCDGANSAVRRALCIPFEGFTWDPWKLVGCDVIYDFEKELGWPKLNFVVDRDDWCIIAYTGEDKDGKRSGSGEPQWRLAYPEPPSLSQAPDEVRKRANERMKQWIRDPKATYEVVRSEPYTMQQRVAKQARKGRVLLAGDALHSNNPMGGLGLTSGICDALCFSNSLVRVINGGEPDSLLTECANARRDTWLMVTNPLSQSNLKRMFDYGRGETANRNIFFDRLKTDKYWPSIMGQSLKNLCQNTFEKPASASSKPESVR